MKFKTVTIFSFSFIALYFTVANAATINIRNNCPYTVWAAAVPGGGRQLDRGGPWDLNVNPGTRGRVWAGTKCQFDGVGRGRCETVDGFNVPMDFSPTSGGCSRGIRCTADIIGQCPHQLKARGSSRQGAPTLSYPTDDQTSTFTCPGGTNYRVVFCP
ncbi:hypothetical protein QUC31_008877 [Theobroma cacao]